jgi:uncharacterized protein YecT (DUF1311 family)
MRALALALMAAFPTAALSDPVGECGGGSQVEIADCLALQEDAAEQSMQTILGFARASAAELDEITERSVALPALEAAQEAWETYRAAQCDFIGSTYGGGSGTGIAIRSCRIELTRARETELRHTIR